MMKSNHLLYKVLSFMLVFLSVFSLFSLSAEAAKKTKKGKMRDINFFQTEVVKEDGRDVLRIEIGVTKDNLEYEVMGDPQKTKQLIVDLKNTRLDKQIVSDTTLDGLLARYITFEEKKKNKRKYTKVMVQMTREYADQYYKVYIKEKDKKLKKPYRIIIDISNQQYFSEFDIVDGIKGKTIIVDPGHGGVDPGAQGQHNLLEKDVNLCVSLRIRDILIASGANCVLTRDSDTDVYGKNSSDVQELKARSDFSKRKPKADIFVSIHCNAAYNEKANGSETYYYPKTFRDKILAEKIQKAIVEEGKRRNRGVKQARFYVLRHSVVPSVLVEMAFISNLEEEKLLSKDSFQRKMAYGICLGIGRYFNEYNS